MGRWEWQVGRQMSDLACQPQKAQEGPGWSDWWKQPPRALAPHSSKRQALRNLCKQRAHSMQARALLLLLSRNSPPDPLLPPPHSRSAQWEEATKMASISSSPASTPAAPKPVIIGEAFAFRCACKRSVLPLLRGWQAAEPGQVPLEPLALAFLRLPKVSEPRKDLLAAAPACASSSVPAP